MTTRTSLAATLLAFLACACALSGPPVAPPQNSIEIQPLVTVRPIEGQPRGLLLELARSDGAAGELALLRRTQDSAFGVHYRFEGAGPVRFLDAAVTPGTRFEYAAALLNGDEILGSSTPIAVTWLAPPAPPTAVRAQALGKHVELAWEGCAECGGAVFRRVLGDRSYRRLPSLSDAGDARFVDLPGTRGTVYGYTVSQVLWSEDVPILGPGCAEVYVESMSDGPLIVAPPTSQSESGPAAEPVQ
jgi:hypothetical protein